MADSADILLIEDHGPVRVLTLNRPSVLNAVSPQLGRALGAALAGLDADPGVQAGIITGAGDRAFCAGADLKAMLGTGPSMGDGGGVITRALRFRPAKPVLAADRRKVEPADVRQALSELGDQARYNQLRQQIMTRTQCSKRTAQMAIAAACQQAGIVQTDGRYCLPD